MAQNSIGGTLRRLVVALLYHSGILGAALRRLQRRAKGRLGLILTYHHIRDSKIEPEAPLSELESGVSVEAFREQVDYLRTQFELMTVADLVKRVRARDKDDTIPLAISFDDGYRSVRESAFPVLQAAGVAATVYVPSAYVDTERRYWWLVVSQLFAEANSTMLNTLAGEIAKLNLDDELIERIRQVNLESAEGRIWGRARVALRVDKLGEERRRQVIELMTGMIDLTQLSAQTLVLQSDELRELTAAGWEVGAHTANHTELTSVAGETALAELTRDREALPGMTGAEISGVAYPYGRHGKATAALAREAGYDYAVTTQAAAVTPATGPHMVPRLSIGLDPTLPQFAWLIYRTLRRGLQQLEGAQDG